MKVLFLTNIPSPYRVKFFNELGKSVELTVLFETNSSTERDKSWLEYKFDNFEGILLKGKRTGYDTAFCPGVISHLSSHQYDVVFVCTIASLTGLLAVWWMKKHGIRYVYEGDGGVPGKKTGIKAAWKRYILHSAEKAFSTNKSFDEYCKTYGVEDANIVRYPFSSIYNKDILDHCLETDEKIKIKRELGITEKHFIISVGRIVSLKGFDVILSAYADRWNSDWGLYIVGGTETEDLRKIIDEQNIQNVHFIDFVLPEQLKKYYQAADFFTLASKYEAWGLVINEAMSNGLPVVVSKQCGAGVAMVEPGENGYLFDCESKDELSGYFQKLMESDEKRYSMGKRALKVVKDYTIEAMAERHEEWLKSSI